MKRSRVRLFLNKVGALGLAAAMILATDGCGKSTDIGGGEVQPSGATTQQTATDQEIEEAEESQAAVEETADTNSNLATPSTTGQLQVKGEKLCGETGETVQLRGLSTHGIGWFPQFINQDAFNEFKNEWGANVIRLAMYTAEGAGYCTGGNKDNLESLVMDGVEYATNADMYVIIDWHILSDNNPNTYKDDAIEFFDEMSKKYADYNNVIYEICNEPNGETSWSDIKNYANEVISAIRANDDDAVIIVGTPTWSQEVDKAAADPIIGYDNIMYTLHFYAATHKGDLRNRMVKAVKNGLPIFVTEYGICDASGNGEIDEDSANEWIRVMNENDISYVCWNISNKNESSAIFKGSCAKTSGFTADDLNQEGIWLKAMLRAAAGLAE